MKQNTQQRKEGRKWERTKADVPRMYCSGSPATRRASILDSISSRASCCSCSASRIHLTSWCALPRPIAPARRSVSSRTSGEERDRAPDRWWRIWRVEKTPRDRGRRGGCELSYVGKCRLKPANRLRRVSDGQGRMTRPASVSLLRLTRRPCKVASAMQSYAKWMTLFNLTVTQSINKMSIKLC